MNKQDSKLPITNLYIGKIIEIDGSHIVAELDHSLTELARTYNGDTYLVGQFGSIIKIHFGQKILYAYVGRLRMKSEYEAEKGIAIPNTNDEKIIEADLFGEGSWIYDEKNQSWKLLFERGVSTYPLPQQNIYLTPKSELADIFENNSDDVLHLGEHVGTGGTPCYADINELIGKHTAILGSTGSGKSGTVAKIVHGLIQFGEKKQIWKPRIIILDPHNEYSKAFSTANRLTTDESTLKLPYWLLSYAELVALIIGKTEFAATSQTNIIKNALLYARQQACFILNIDKDKINIDSPVPFSLVVFKKHIDDDKPSQESRQESHKSILQKIETLQRDARLKFMISEWESGKDEFVEIINQLISTNQPTIIDLSGIPNEVAGITSVMLSLY